MQQQSLDVLFDMAVRSSIVRDPHGVQAFELLRAWREYEHVIQELGNGHIKLLAEFVEDVPFEQWDLEKLSVVLRVVSVTSQELMARASEELRHRVDVVAAAQVSEN